MLWPKPPPPLSQFCSLLMQSPFLSSMDKNKIFNGNTQTQKGRETSIWAIFMANASKTVKHHESCLKWTVIFGNGGDLSLSQSGCSYQIAESGSKFTRYGRLMPSSPLFRSFEALERKIS